MRMLTQLTHPHAHFPIHGLSTGPDGGGCPSDCEGAEQAARPEEYHIGGEDWISIKGKDTLCTKS